MLRSDKHQKFTDRRLNKFYRAVVVNKDNNESRVLLRKFRTATMAGNYGAAVAKRFNRMQQLTTEQPAAEVAS